MTMELRREALQLAVQSGIGGSSHQTTIVAAEAYFQFLIGQTMDPREETSRRHSAQLAAMQKMQHPDIAVADKPAFEVVTEGHHFAIYADGRTEGFAWRPIAIVNRIPLLIAKAWRDGADAVSI